MACTGTRTTDPICTSGEPLKLKEAEFLKQATIIRFVDRVAFNRLQGMHECWYVFVLAFRSLTPFDLLCIFIFGYFRIVIRNRI